MTGHGIIVFAIAFGMVVVSPGPGLAAFVGQILGHGLRVAPLVAIGIYLGDLFWFTLAATGLAALAQAFASVFLIVKWLGVCYLVYLAWKMWTTSPVALATATTGDRISNWKLLLSGLTVTLSNPKAIVFYLAILPALIDLRQLDLAGYGIAVGLIALVLFTCLAAYALAAHAARGFFRSPLAMRNLNRVSGTAIAGAAVAIALRQ